MRVPKEMQINRYDALVKVIRFFVCKARCGNDCGNATCDYIARMYDGLNDVKIKPAHNIRKEVAVLTNGFHEDN